MIGLVKNILSILSKEQKRKLYIMQILVVITAIAEVCSVAIIGPFMALAANMDQINSNTYINHIYILSQVETHTQFLIISGLIVLFLLLISTILSIITIKKLSMFAAITGAEIGDSLYSSYLKKDYLFHINVNSSVLIKQIATEVNRVTDNILQPFVQINARLFTVLFISISIFIYKPLISIIGITVFSLSYFLLFTFVKKRLYINGINISTVSQQRFLLMNEGFGSIKDVLILNRQKDFIKKFKESGIIYSKAYGSSNTLYNMPKYIMEFIMYSSMIALIIALLHFSKGNLGNTIATLAVLGVATFKLLPSFQQIYSSAAQIRSNLSALYSIQDDLILARENETSHISILKQIKEYNFSNNDLIIDNISFKYPHKNEYILKDVSMIIPNHSTIGLVGASGAGKSTLLDILLGLLVPTEGEFLVGETIITSDNVSYWQKKIGYVPQNIFLKDATLLENIAFGLPKSEIDIEAVHNAIELAQLADWVAELPEGLYSSIGEKGVQISGGQKQRIGIARALYNNIDYLFLDEATSALDGKTEQLIMKAIENISHSKTIIMIAHRLNTVKNCDKIFVFKDGRVVASDNYSNLMQYSDIFREISGDKNV